jgi:hypothetical protein
MSEHGKRDPLDDWRVLEDLRAQVDLDQVVATSPEERREALRKAGMDPEEAHRIVDALLDAAEEEHLVVSSRRIGSVEPLHASTVRPPPVGPSRDTLPAKRIEVQRRASAASIAWGLTLSAAAVLLLVLSWKGHDGVAWWKGGSSPPPPAPTTGAPPPSVVAHPPPSVLAQAAQAAALRDQAFAACGKSDWTTCGADLDKAKDLDPPGDLAPRVVLARQNIYDATHPNEELEAKPKK